MFKSAQVTAFVILGLTVLVFVLFFVFFMRSDLEEFVEEDVFDSANFRHISSSCADFSAKESVFLGFNSFIEVDGLEYYFYEQRIYNPENSEEYFLFELKKPIYLDKKEEYIFVPEASNFEERFNEVFALIFKNCLNSHEYLDDSFDINNLYSSVEVRENDVFFNVEYDALFEQRDLEINQKEQKMLSYSLKEKLGYIEDYLLFQKNNDYFASSFLVREAYNKDYVFVFNRVDAETFYVEFIFEDFKELYEHSLKHGFIVSFDWGEEDE